MWGISQMVCMVLLIVLSVIDIRCRKVPELLLILGNIGAVWYQFQVRNTDLWLLAVGLSIGLVFLGVSRLTGEQIGYGDSWAILIMGIFLGAWAVLEVLLTAFLLLFLGAAFCLLYGRDKGKGTLPFIPFLTAGYALTLFMGGV